MSRANTAVYLYCLVRATTRPSAARVPAGVPGAARPTAHPIAASLWMIAADVPLDVFGPSELEPRLRDLDWVSNAAIAHEAVVEHFSKAAAVIPMKLFTMFSSLDKARADVSARKDAVQRAMRRIAGAEEWGIRVFRRLEAPASGTSQARPVSGAEFLRARKQARDAAATARTAAADAAERAFLTLRRCARDARVREAGREAGSNPPVLDAAFLVPTTARARFKREARRQAAALVRAGADLVLTGPWPAYNFVATEEPS
jgi:gas vesicle protein GvpL/GvpF